MAPIRCCFDQTAVWHSDAARGPSTPSLDYLNSTFLSKSWLLLELRDGAQITQPSLRRATQKLQLRDKLVALTSGANADHVYLRVWRSAFRGRRIVASWSRSRPS